MNHLLCVAAGVLLVAASGPTPAEDLSIMDAIAIASRDAPTLLASAEQVEAARQSSVPAGALPDPKLVLGLDNVPVEGADRYSLSRDFMTMQRVGVAQEFPSRAKRDARVDGAQSRIAVAEAESRVARLEAIKQTAAAWIARDTTERQLALVESLSTENRLFEQAVRARLLSGQGAATEAVTARQEAALIEERRDELRARREQATAALRQWIGSEAAVRPLSGETPDWPIDSEMLLHGVQNHPEFALFDARARTLDAGVAEARAARRPDWAMEVAYQRRGPQYSDLVSLQFSVDLPVFTGSRQNPQIAARQAERRALEADREAGVREHSQMLESELAEYHRLRSAVERQRNVFLPLADEKAALALADWRGGKGGIIEVIDARRERIDARLRLLALEGDKQQIAASLHYAYAEHSGELP